MSPFEVELDLYTQADEYRKRYGKSWRWMLCEGLRLVVNGGGSAAPVVESGKAGEPGELREGSGKGGGGAAVPAEVEKPLEVVPLVPSALDRLNEWRDKQRTTFADVDRERFRQGFRPLLARVDGRRFPTEPGTPACACPEKEMLGWPDSIAPWWRPREWSEADELEAFGEDQRNPESWPEWKKELSTNPVEI